MADHSRNDSSVDYKKTLNLPHTDFPLRAQAKSEDPRILARWKHEDVYTAATRLHAGAEKFILHDGPPYANGHIHLGHAYNKILKDIITKAYRMAGYHTPVIPGWDCHGLPIELKVTKEHHGLSPEEVMKQCRATAAHWITVQKEEFRTLGVVMDWDHPYSTMDFSYEAAIVRAFAVFVKKNFITRNFKTVAWCASCETTLAAAEIEYHDRKDPSVFVLFPLTQVSIEKAVPAFMGTWVSLLVWTTTPWTLPLNRAVAVKPHADYVVIALDSSKTQYAIVGKDTLATLQKVMDRSYEIVATIPSSLFETCFVHHPFEQGRTVPLIFDENVGTDEGTACVHIAPGCGPSDYELGVRNGLEIYSPITTRGAYASGIYPAELEGMAVTEGQGWVIKELEQRGLLFFKTSLKHSYPHCWRCRNGLIYRATKQWFLSLKQQGLQERAIKEVDSITFVPERSSNFLRATLGSRWEWCLSRQRVWGVPIPALLCNDCDSAYITPEWLEKIACTIEQQGIEWWRMVPVGELVPGPCACCKGNSWRKETDILDVWFESGVSHYAVLVPRQEFPADMYLEGVDQHRAWFQSSLLTALVVEEEAPMRVIMSHGFTVDEQGRKMSKSIGNVVQSQELIDILGTDGIRLWVTCIDHESDIVVSKQLLDNIMKVYLKVRNTCRFFLQNVADFNVTDDTILYEKLHYLDAVALAHFARFHEATKKQYLAFNMTGIFHGLADYCTTQLSAVYCDILKDRLYVEARSGHLRRSAQTVLFRMLDALTRLMAPVLSFTAEHVAEYYRPIWTGSVHLQTFDTMSVEQLAGLPEQGPELWEMLQDLRSHVMKLLEAQRVAEVIKHSLQAKVVLSVSIDYKQYPLFQEFMKQVAAYGENPAAVLQELLVVSQVELVDEVSQGQQVVPGIQGYAEHAQGVKCPRCWKWQESRYADGLCDRCDGVIRSNS
jgi:isoleucyl-tRNA synthetase